MAKKDPDLFYILYLVCRYVTPKYNTYMHIYIYIYIYNGRSGCFVLTGGSASDGSNAKRSAIFFKMSKANHTKIVTFRKQFSLSFVNIYSLICLSFGIFPKKRRNFS